MGLRVSRVFSVIGWNLLILAVGLLAIEAIFGGWFSANGFGALRIPRNVELRHEVTNAGKNDGIAIYRRDRWGLRGAHKSPGEIHVLAIGGSTTNELYVDDNQTWTAVLQQRFAAAGRTVVIANAGIDGHSTVGHLNSFELWFPHVPDLKPKFVLFYVAINDVQVEEHSRYDTITPPTPWQRFQRYVSNESALNSAFRTLRGMVRARRARLVYLKDPPDIRPIDGKPVLDAASYDVRIGKYAARLAALASKTREWGARPIFITQRRGDAFTIDGKNYATGPNALRDRLIQNLFNAATLRVCRATREICIDLAGEIDLTAADFTDAIHTRPTGSRRIGFYLYDKLKDIF
jgi:lysophospholipase L1-like esterase